MGIELPAELTGLAAAAGVRWPQADEDGMRAQAAAWRKAADQLSTVTSAADGSAAKALCAISGDTAEAAGKHWNTITDPDSGPLSTAVRGAHAAADRLDSAAERIGAAKVVVVRNLVDLAKNQDALHALGHSGAAQTALRGTAANVAAVHQQLTSALSGRDVPEPAPNANHGWTAPAPRTDPPGVHGTEQAGQPTGDGARQADPWPGSAGSPQGDPGGAAQWDAGARHEDNPGSRSPDVAVPGTVQEPHVQPGGGAQADFPGDGADTGPLPAQGPHQAGTVSAAAAATATPLADTGYELPTPRSGVPQPPPGMGVVQPGVAGEPSAPGQSAGAYSAAPAPRQPPSPTPDAPAPRSSTPRQAVPTSAPAEPSARRPGQSPARSAAPGAFDGSARDRAEPVAAQGQSPAKPRDRDVEVSALFRIHMFPIGHMPKPRHRPLRQLPAPDGEHDRAPGLRFPPQDHPRSALISDQAALGAQQPYRPAPSAEHDLTEDYHPLGELHERDWDRRFLVRPAGEGDAEYAWPPGEMHPEGGCDHGEPLVLEPGTELDRFGTEEGRVFSTPVTPFAKRALPPDYASAAYRRYRVLRPLPVWWALSAAWFAQPGGGPRYRTTYSAADLLALGYLEPLGYPESLGDNDER